MKEKIMNCFGQSNQEKVVNGHDLEVISHVMLLPGQKKTGCSGKDLENEYYLIKSTNIHTGSTEMFYAGVGSFQGSKSSKGLKELENQKRVIRGQAALTVPPRFNPLTQPHIGAAGTGAGAAGGGTLHPSNQEIWDVLQLLITIWDINGTDGVFLDIKNAINVNPMCRIAYRYIKAINTLVSRDSIISSSAHPTVNNLQELLEYYRHHPTKPWDFRAFNFNNLQNEINYGIAQNWGITQNYIQ